jgi:hypothetical protein
MALALVTVEAVEAKAERGTRSRAAAATSKSSRTTKAVKKKAPAKSKAKVKAKRSKAKRSASRVRASKSKRTVKRSSGRRIIRSHASGGSRARLGYALRDGVGFSTTVLPSPTTPPKDILKLALQAYACGEAEGAFDQPYLTIIDYSMPSAARRLWVLDVRTRRVLFHELVAHGRNSGDAMASEFSNVPGSYQTSIGLYRTEDVYLGQHGGSLRLSGLEPGYNDLAWDRAIVIHGASYVSADHIAEYGRLGRSLGCPALPYGVHQRIIERIQGGSAVFAYYPDRDWLRNSRYLHCRQRLVQR